MIIPTTLTLTSISFSIKQGSQPYHTSIWQTTFVYCCTVVENLNICTKFMLTFCHMEHSRIACSSLKYFDLEYWRPGFLLCRCRKSVSIKYQNTLVYVMAYLSAFLISHIFLEIKRFFLFVPNQVLDGTLDGGRVLCMDNWFGARIGLDFFFHRKRVGYPCVMKNSVWGREYKRVATVLASHGLHSSTPGKGSISPRANITSHRDKASRYFQRQAFNIKQHQLFNPSANYFYP
ncbi:uncharacterized protein BDR25DRAFT_357842 [Lindgomyces ingoldianus]|uniref:Uncharacterized protein n=1 Tax=Lindgomyces ingoldianus TaxID=673940 RepID=A0ACB6QP79_9PLEO|nr:uncharacterized protein BDR25DRAFT_357842 [Lindgomyces ingoldianus]KAF2468087.1 hypothetical protein BDR25DRAFT_357842 [Lindgomyces ingoldianus]